MGHSVGTTGEIAMTKIQQVKATFQPEPFFRRIFYVVVAAGVGVGAVAPMIDWDKFEWSSTFFLPLGWAFFRAAVGYWRSEFAKDPNASWLRFIAIAVIASLAIGVGGCASTTQRVTTMDGDTFMHRGYSLLSKQQIQADAAMEVYPNNSGMNVEIGTKAAQDAEAMVPIITAIVQAVISSGLGSRPQTPSNLSPNSEIPSQTVLSRINDALLQIQELRETISSMGK